MPVVPHTYSADVLSADDVLYNVDYRQLTVFCLGWLFITSINCIIFSPFIRFLFTRLFTRDSGSTPSPTDAESSSEKSALSDIPTHLVTKGEYHTLIFVLSLCFASSSVTMFASLCSFTPGAEVACRFIIVWSSVTSQAAHLVGILIIFMDLRRLNIKRWESVVFSIGVFTGTGFIVVNSIISTSILSPINGLGIIICYRRHFLPASLATSSIFAVLEVYSIFRLWSLLAPRFLRLNHQLQQLKDVRVLRASSLLILELLTAVPYATKTNIMTQFLPFSIGSLLVLAAFNFKYSTEEEDLVMDSIPVTAVHSSASSVRPSIAPITPPNPNPTILRHPFAASSLADQSPLFHEPPTRRSSYSPVVRYATRAKSPFGSDVNPFPDLLTFPPSAEHSQELLMSGTVLPKQRDSPLLPPLSVLSPSAASPISSRQDSKRLSIHVPPVAYNRLSLGMVDTPHSMTTLQSTDSVRTASVASDRPRGGMLRRMPTFGGSSNGHAHSRWSTSDETESSHVVTLAQNVDGEWPVPLHA